MIDFSAMPFMFYYVSLCGINIFIICQLAYTFVADGWKARKEILGKINLALGFCFIIYFLSYVNKTSFALFSSFIECR